MNPPRSHGSTGQTLNATGAAILYLLLWAPLLVIALYSFNAARIGAGWTGFSLAAYSSLFHNSDALRALRNTLVLAAASTLISTVLGSLLGYGLGRFRFPGQRAVHFLLRIPVLLPDIVFAVGLILAFDWAARWTSALTPGMGPMILGHATFQIPFVALVVRARTEGLDPSLEEAARDLGATPLASWFRITLPLLTPGILGGALLALTLSLDDFAVSFFTSGPGSTTLPVLIYASARRGITPDINALATLLMTLTLLIVLLSMRRVRA